MRRNVAVTFASRGMCLAIDRSCLWAALHACLWGRCQVWEVTAVENADLLTLLCVLPITFFFFFFFEKTLFCLSFWPINPCLFFSPSVVFCIPLNNSALYDSSTFSCTFMNHGLSIASFRSVIGLNIHFIGFNFDFIGQREISCSDNVSFCFTDMYESKLFNTE